MIQTTALLLGISLGIGILMDYLRYRRGRGWSKYSGALSALLVGAVCLVPEMFKFHFNRDVQSSPQNFKTSTPAMGQMGSMSNPTPDAPQSPPISQVQIRRQEKMAMDVMKERPLEPTRLPNGTKRFVLTASVFPWHLYNGQTYMAWGYNHQVPGPLLRFQVGDRVELVIHNQLPDNTTVHWHGFAVPNAMDGIPGVTQAPIPPGGSYTYKFTVTPQMLGTHYYHSHVNDDFQIDQGLQGPLIVDPKISRGKAYDVDALYEIGSFKVGGSETENVFTLDGKPYPEDPQLNVKLGSRVRIRFINASAEESHVMHLHGYTFQVVALDGNPVAHPQAQNTVLLGPSQTADVAFVANNKGRWMLHCHIADHMMNPEDYMDDMGGLVTYVNVN